MSNLKIKIMKNFCEVKAWIDHYCIEHETTLNMLEFLVLIFAIVGFLGLFGIFWGIGIIIGCIAALFMSCLEIKLHKVVMYAFGLGYIALVAMLKKGSSAHRQYQYGTVNIGESLTAPWPEIGAMSGMYLDDIINPGTSRDLVKKARKLPWYYELLELSPETLTVENLKAAYQRKILAVHPDKNQKKDGSDGQIQKIKEAKLILEAEIIKRHRA